MVDLETVRLLHRRLEPLHAFIYFSPDANLRYVGLGLEPGWGYFASRSAAMGAVGSEVVVATFFNFRPDLVRAALPASWARATPEQVLAERLAGADETLRKILGDQIDDPGLVEAASLARTAAEACTPEGRALYAAHATLPWPDPPHLALFHAITLLREYRGDGHIAALVLEGLSNVEALITHAASGELGLPEGILQATRGFSDDEWAAAKAGMVERGLLDADGAMTPDGAAQRRRIEERTDAADRAPWEALGEEGCRRLLEVSAPFSRAVVKSGVFLGALQGTEEGAG